MAEAADTAEAAAVDLAEWLVARGTPFRQAHGTVAQIVREAAERRVPMGELVSAHPDLGPEALTLLEPGTAVTRRTTPGGAGPGPVADQVRRFTQQLADDLDRLPAP